MVFPNSLGQPTGTVTFSESGNVVGIGSLGSNAVAQIVVTSFPIGPHFVTCTYSGDSNYTPSAGGANFTVATGNTTVMVTASRNPAPPNTTVVFVVDLTAMGGTPTGGLVTIYDGSAVLFSGPMLSDDGELVFSTSSLAPGAHNITVTYGGDNMFTGGQTAHPLVLIVSRYSTSISFTTDLTQAAFGQTITGTVQVTAAPVAPVSGSPAVTPGTPTGAVTITDHGAVVGSGTLAAGLATIAISGLAPGSHNLIANYTGDANFDVSSSTPVAATVAPGKLQVISSASGAITVAPDSLVSLIGTSLAPPNAAIAGSSTVVFKDSTGTERSATLTYVGSGQINAVVPSLTAVGPATVSVRNASGDIAVGTVTIAPFAPGLFTADNTPTGVVAAVVETLHPDQTITSQDTFQCTNNVCMTIPISLGNPGDQVYLLLFATGIRNAKQPVTVRIAGQNLTPLYAGPQPSFPGLDQVNVILPPSLNGTGKTTVAIVIADQTSNAATLQLQ